MMETAVNIKAVLLIGVVVGFLVLLFWKKRRAGIYVGIGLVIVVMGGVFFLIFARHQTAQRYEAQAHVDVIRQEEAARRDSYSSVDPFWQVTVENEFEADVYPSVERAAAALGRKIAPQVAAFATQRTPAPKAYIMTYGVTRQGAEIATKVMDLAGDDLNSIKKQPSFKLERSDMVEKAEDIVAIGLSSPHGLQGELEERALEAVWRELNSIIKLPSFRIERVPEDPDRKAQIRSSEDALVLFVHMSSKIPSPAPGARTGRQETYDTLEVIVRSGKEESKESVQFIEKPWVTNFSLFLSQAPQAHYFIAQSRRPCTSSSEARYQAMEDASKQLAYRIIENAGRYRQQFNLGKRSAWDLRQIQALVRTELEESGSNRYQATSAPHEVHDEVSSMNQNRTHVRGKYICDRFVQGFDRSYGATVWREALLVDASKANVDELAGMYARTLRQERESWLKIVLSAMGMLGIVCVVYVFLNSATKGYYKAALGVAALVVAVVIIGIAVVLS